MNDFSISYLQLRRLIGVLGVSMPLVIIGGALLSDFFLAPNLSFYYYTNTRDFFTSILIFIGVFLITYKGYDKVDITITTIAGIGAILTALFPSNPSNIILDKVGVFLLPKFLSGYIHFIAATFFLLSLGYISFFQFTKSNGEMTEEKKKRNFIYRVCGIMIFTSFIITTAAFGIKGSLAIEQTKLLLITEMTMILPFGISWLVKGEAILKDKKI